MRPSISFLAALAGCAIALSWGCSGGSGTVSSVSRPSTGAFGDTIARPSGPSSTNTGDGLLYVDNFYPMTIEVYRSGVSNPAPLYTISKGLSNSYNLAVDRAGTLYVEGNNNTITEFPKGKTSPSKVLHEPAIGYGTGVFVVVGDEGTVYSVDHYNSVIYEFAHGSRKPTSSISIPHPIGIALDRENDLYTDYLLADGNYGVMKFKPGQTTGHDLGIQLATPGGIGFDKDDNLLLGDEGPAPAIYIYKKGAKTPFRQIDTAPSYPYQFAFDRTQEHLYLVGFAEGAPPVTVYDYATGSVDWTVTQGFNSQDYATGVALSPAAPF
jgi:hypothetical protein